MSETNGALAVDTDDCAPAPPPFAPGGAGFGEPIVAYAGNVRGPVSESQAGPSVVGSLAVAASAPCAVPPAPKSSSAANDNAVPEAAAAKGSLLESMGAYLTSMVVHLVLFVVLAATLGTAQHFGANFYGDAPSFKEVELDAPGELLELQPFKLDHEADVEPSEIDVTMQEAHAIAPQEAKHHSEAEKFDEAGGAIDKVGGNLGGSNPDFRAIANGPARNGPGGLGPTFGTSDNAGTGGARDGFGGRDQGSREEILGRQGGTKATERGVGAALNWLARHQNIDGSWSLDKYTKRCKGGLCSGHAPMQADAAATALGLLPFLGAGHTHKGKPEYKELATTDKEKYKILKDYQERVNRGLQWLIKHQNTVTGDLSAGSQHVMYTHGLATIALCEAYAMTGDQRIGYPAQAAVDFIVKTQSKQLGGWRYVPGDFDSDTSVVGWQLMALKSAQMANLDVPQQAFEGVAKWLTSVASGNYGGFYAYRVGQGPTPSMTSVGMLCRQYLGAPREAGYLMEGREYLMKNMPGSREGRNIYYWYYATQAMHHMMGPEWDKWNRKMRKELVSTQSRGPGCSTGSWDPEKPSNDEWGERGGRLMMTSLSCLTLEVYYRYLPLYDLESKPKKKDANEPGKDAAAADAK